MASKKAAAPVTVEAVITVGSEVRFLGYSDDVPENERYLTEGEVYNVAEIEETDDGTVFILHMENPDFNSRKAESEDNPKLLSIEAFPEEIELVASAEETEEVVTKAKGKGKAAAKVAPSTLFKDEEEQEEEAPAPAKTKGKGKTVDKAETKAPAKGKGKAKAAEAVEEEEEAPAPAKAKGKTKAAAPAPATKKAVAKKAPVQEEEEGEDGDVMALLPEDSEDQAVLSMVNESEDLTELARDLETDIGRNEFYIGGVLYHIKKSGEYKKVNDGAYTGNEGWKNYVEENFNMGYRKAQHLLEIYVTFSGSGVENPADVVARLGWTKAQKLVKALTHQPERAEEFVSLAEVNTVMGLSEVIKDEISTGEKTTTTVDNRVKQARTTLKFRYLEEDARVVEGILAEAAGEYGVDPGTQLDEALMRVLVDWSEQRRIAEPEPQPATRKAAGKSAAKGKAAGKVAA